MHSPSKEHMYAVYRVLKYLKSSPKKCLFFERNKDYEITGYTNADWARDQTDQNQHLGILCLLERIWLPGGARSRKS